jgi:hypothetical protein
MKYKPKVDACEGTGSMDVPPSEAPRTYKLAQTEAAQSPRTLNGGVMHISRDCVFVHNGMSTCHDIIPLVDRYRSPLFLPSLYSSVKSKISIPIYVVSQSLTNIDSNFHNGNMTPSTFSTRVSLL